MVAMVMLVSPFEVDRVGLENLLLERDTALEFHGVDREAALDRIARERFDAVLVDMHFWEVDPLAILESIFRARPDQVVMLLACFENARASVAACAMGAMGVLLKTDSSVVLHSKLRRAMSGQSMWSKEKFRTMSISAASMPNANLNHPPLTEREEEVVSLLAKAKTNREISEALDIQYDTVKQHVQSILKKIGVPDRTQAAVWAKLRA
jgi:DNA-binding NarL/FixJ family response regulator